MAVLLAAPEQANGATGGPTLGVGGNMGVVVIVGSDSVGVELGSFVGSTGAGCVSGVFCAPGSPTGVLRGPTPLVGVDWTPSVAPEVGVLRGPGTVVAVFSASGLAVAVALPEPSADCAGSA